jgi:hypothetical protein
MYYLVSKIISWKTKSLDSFCVQNQDKITKDEWRRYEKHLLGISKSEYAGDVRNKLRNIFQTIKENEAHIHRLIYMVLLWNYKYFQSLLAAVKVLLNLIFKIDCPLLRLTRRI